jgi:hypothetical protein
MTRIQRTLAALLTLTLLAGVAWGESETDSHTVSVAYNVALVDVDGTPLSNVVFDNAAWGDDFANGLSAVQTRTSSMSYTLAGGEAAEAGTITAQLSGATDTLSALRVSLFTSATGQGAVTPFTTIDEGVPLLEFGMPGTAGAATSRILITTPAHAGVTAANINLTYIFQIDVTQGPAFDLTELTVTFTATAAAP